MSLQLTQNTDVEWFEGVGPIWDALDSSRPWTFDIETNGEDYKSPNFVITMIGISDGRNNVVCRDDNIWYAIAKLALHVQNGKKIAGYNSIAFDAPAIAKRYPQYQGLPCDDAMILAYVHDETISSGWEPGRAGLQAQVVKYFDVAPWKDAVTWDWSNYNHAEHWRTAATYNARDARYTHDLFSFFDGALSPSQRLLYEHLLKPAARVFVKIHENGIPISRSNLEQAATEIDAAVVQSRADVTAFAASYGFEKFNPRSTKQLRALIYDTLKYTPKKFTDKGSRPSTDAESLQGLRLENDIPMLGALQIFRENDKLKGSYIDKCRAAITEQSRIHNSLSIIATDTGRTAEYGEFPPQRVPRKKTLRRIVAAPPGKKLIVADLSQIELRTMAFLSRDPMMLKVYQEGLFGGDMHAFMALEKNKRLRGESTFTEEDRFLAKATNFSCCYGAEPFTIRAKMLKDYGILVTMSEAAMLRDDIFFAAFSTLPDYFHSEIMKVKGTRKDPGPGIVYGQLGRKRALPNIFAWEAQKREEAARQIINTPNQAFGSDIALCGMIVADHTIKDLMLCAFIHDAIIAEVPDDRAESQAREIKECFEIGAKEYLLRNFNLDFDLPIKCDVKVTQEWGA